MTEDELSNVVIGCAIEVHKHLGGPGLLESVYEGALTSELRRNGLSVETQVSVPVVYKGEVVGDPMRIDMLVEGKLIIECKATTQYNDIFEVQLLTYLRLTEKKLGLVINFGERRVKDGIHRVVNGL